MARSQALKATVTVRRSVLNQLPAALQSEGERIVAEAAREGEKVAKKAAPVATGFMRNNIVVEGSGNSRTLRSKANYSGYVNFGTRYMGARPFFTEGAEAMNNHMLSEWKKVEGRLPHL